MTTEPLFDGAAAGAAQDGAAASPAPVTFEELRRYFTETIMHETTTADDHRAMFARVVASEATITGKEGLGKLKVAQLKRIAGYGPSERKADLVRYAWHNLLQDFTLASTFSYSFGEKFEAVCARYVERVTAESLADYRERRRASDRAADERRATIEKALENPETEEEFKIFCRVKGEAALTDEQLRRYDELRGDHAVTRREKELVDKATIRRVDGVATLTMEIVKRHHSRRDCDVWIVTLSERVGRATFEELCIAARRLGGNYAREWRPTNSPAGFMFDEEEKAEQFVALQQGDQVNEDRLDQIVAHRDQIRENAAEHFDNLSGRMIERAEASLAADRKLNTPRRVHLATVAEDKAHDALQMAGTLTNTAARLRARTSRMLDRIRWRTHAETFETLLRWADGDLRKIEFPYPRVSTYNLEEIAERIGKRDGCVMLTRRIERLMRGAQGRVVTFRTPPEVELLEAFCRKARLHRAAPRAVESIRGDMAYWKRMRLMRIASVPELREAVREHQQNRGSRRTRSAYLASALEAQLPGFFPTPRDVVKLMLAYVQMEDGMFWLEPEAGMGHIVTVVRSFFKRTRYDLVEIRERLRAELYARGLWDEGREMARDFMAFDPRTRAGFEGYDAILANPPFEGGQDIEHVRRMYDFLHESRGRLVSVVSESSFGNLDDEGEQAADAEAEERLTAKKREFRQWLAGVGGASVKLPDGAFLASDRPVNVATRLVVIDRAAPVAASAAAQVAA
ncbi:MAG TPA: hypothetical protein VIP46_22055 [Pyrinomonadaceae bacterium]